jgi:hypothetical protein
MTTLGKSPLEALYAGHSPQEAGRLFGRLVRKIFLRVLPHSSTPAILRETPLPIKLANGAYPSH